MELRLTFETLICRLFRDGIQVCSGLVDLVVCIVRHGGGRHGLASVGERVVYLVAVDIAQVGDRSTDLGDPPRGEGTGRMAGDGGRKTTPAMAAGVANHVWTCREIAALLDRVGV